jgi:hypothetical protein
MMGLPIPKDVTERLDKLENNMSELVTELKRTNELLREQNEILRGNSSE